MQTKSHPLLSAAPLFLVIFIDGMGLSILFPILSIIITNPSTHFLSTSYSADIRNILYGLVVGIFMLCWFFGAAILSDLSDKIGRKKSLLICLIGSFLGYLLGGFAITVHSVWLLVLGRVIDGFTAGSQPIAQASVVDLSTEKNKTFYIGLTLFFVSIGFILGPILGGFLTDNQLVTWFNYTTPLYFGAAISLLNIILLLVLFRETFNIKKNVKIKLTQSLILFASAFKHKSIRALSLIFLVMVLGWSNYFSYVSLFLYKQFNFTANEIGIFMGLIGVGFAIGFAYLANFFAQRFPLEKIFMITIFINGLSVFLTAISPYSLLAWLFVVPASASQSIGYATIISIFSNQVDKTKQGWIMGITGSILALGFGITGLLGGIFTNMEPALPLLLSTSGLIFSGILMGILLILRKGQIS